jgi:hypothetical protein
MEKKIRKTIIITALSVIIITGFFGMVIIDDLSKKGIFQKGVKEADLTELADIQDYMNAFPDYTFKIVSEEQQVHVSYSEFLKRYNDSAEFIKVTGKRTDGETIESEYYGLPVSVLFNQETVAEFSTLIIYGTDLYAVPFNLQDTELARIFLVWRDRKGYLYPRIILKDGSTKFWLKRPVIFEFTESFDDTVPLKDRLDEDSLEFVTQNRLFTLSIGTSPRISADEWNMKVYGHVERTMSLTYQDLKSRPSSTVYAVLETISNPPGGGLIGNVLLTGTPLKLLLEEAGLQEDAREVVFRCADNYSTSITIDEALSDNVLLAYRLNGRELAVRHGYPVRAAVPGKYGMKWAKWITEIEVVDYDYKGYWERQGWSDYAGRDAPSERYD